MAQPEHLNVKLSTEALSDLDEITAWNIEQNGFDQAVRYRTFLLNSISQLPESYSACRQVKNRPDLRFTVLRWSSRGHGHIVVFVVDESSGTIRVAKLYHTSQNWEKLVRRSL